MSLDLGELVETVAVAAVYFAVGFVAAPFVVALVAVLVL